MERDLVERAQKGDRDAFASLVHQVSDALFAVAHRNLRDTDLAEDALQDALITAWRQLPHLREPDRFEAWVHRILVHACYAEARRSRRWTANVRVLPVDGPALPTRTSPSPTAMNWSGPSAGSRSTSGRSSSITTTSGCPSSRSPRRSASRLGRPDLACITQHGPCARP